MKTIAIVGRPNVGKSTLFNRIIGRREAIVTSTPGVTRDRIYGIASYGETSFVLIDTGGIVFSDDSISKEVLKQTKFAIDEADRILFVVDAKTGLHPLDKEIANILRKTGNKKICLIINKVDSGKILGVESDFMPLGIEPMFQISAAHNSGISELLAWATEGISGEYKIKGYGIAVVGKPNVGKSLFVNSILGYERSIVSRIPGTTRDSIDTFIKFGKDTITLIDTAGLKRKSHIKGQLEYYTLLRTARAIERADVSILLVDSIAPLSRQDKRIFSYIEDGLKGVVIGLSKFDIIEKNLRKRVLNYFKKALHFIDFAPIIPVSSITGEGLKDIMELSINIAKKRKQRRSKKELNQIIREAVRKFPPPIWNKRTVRIYSIKEEGPGRFLLYVNFPNAIEKNYIKYLENSLRQGMDFFGLPIRIIPSRRNK